ncbi:unnamed protein product [Haemonchus placei]|uniref:Anion exchange protein n=1 Tax=Haemonchus placei TaxID=6290 RepID=A0A158QPF4_HAEPC|nr:unnamed protein product [Haemonchus placei]
MFLLKEKDDTPALFTEMGELGLKEWRETARWVKFEEDVEQGGNRWSKPHVATLSLHSLFQLRSCLLNGLFMNDMTETDLPAIIGTTDVCVILFLDVLIEEFVKEGDIEEDMRDELREILMRKHVHQYEQELKGMGSKSIASYTEWDFSEEQAKKNGANGDKSGFLSTVRSISDIGKSFSHGRNLGKLEKEQFGPQLELPKVSFWHIWQVESLPRDMNKDGSSGDISKGNTHFLKKLPHGVEASNVLIGEVDFLQRHICAFVRLKTANVLGDLTEVPVPTRFIFLMLGPTGHGSQYKEIGRAIATLMADEIFHDVAYKARNKEDLLDGVDEFLDQVMNKLLSVYLPGHGSDPALKRTGRLFGGLILDIKRKAPHFISDFTDAFNLQCLATTCFMYFALLAPIVTFGGLLEEATHQRMAAMENLFGGAICGVVYHLFSGQPLTIIGSTGPVLVFETIVYDFCLRLGIQYLSFRFWVHVWTATIIFIMCITDASALVSYITRFTEESFATLIAVIFIYEAIMKLWKIKSQLDVINYSRDAVEGTCFCEPPSGKPLITIEKAGEYISKQGLAIAHNKTFIDYAARMRNSCYFPSRVRQIFSDFAVMISIVIMTLIDMGAAINTPKLNVPSSFRPTWDGRGWFIPPFDGNPLWTAPLAALPALLACILIFMDQQITTVIVNRKENKLKKGCGYHLDLLVLAILIFIVGVLGLPIYVAATVLSINHINSLKVESECKAPGEVAQFIGVREQRVTGIVTFLMIGLSVLITNFLGKIPMPVLYGVFLYMGISALGGIQLFDRILLLLMPMKYQPDTIYIRHVPIKKIHLFTAFQVGCLGVLWTVKSIKTTSLTFPVMLVVMVAVRKLMEKFFTATDLKYLDDPMPDFHLRKKEDLKRRQSVGEPVDIELEDNQATIHAVKTEAHLHIPMASGNVIKIPLAAIQEPSHSINMTKEVNSSGMWKHISSRDSRNSLDKEMPKTAVQNEAPLETPEEDEDAIMIKVIRPSPHGSSTNLSESQPLLKDKDNDKASPV